MSGNGNKEFENNEMQLWLRNKNMVKEKLGVPVLQVRKKRRFASSTKCFTKH
jgi:hypothetical protein